MNNVVILPPNFPEHLLENISVFYIGDIRIPIGIIKHEEIDFWSAMNKDGMVLIRKDAFSCNYRDKAIIINFATQLHEKRKNGIFAYSPIGSEFVGTVIDVGKGVDVFKIGDRVIPNAQYPAPVSNDFLPGIPTNQASKRIQAFNEKRLLKIPNEIPDEIAASITISGHTVFSMIEKAQITKAKNVLLTSLKSNTSLATAIALKKRGCNLWGLTTSTGFEEKFKKMGIENIQVLNDSTDDLIKSNVFNKFVLETGGFDVVIDPFADLYLGKVTSCMTVDSKYISCGLYDQMKLSQLGQFKYLGKNISEIMNDCIMRNISIIGNCLGEKRHLEQAIDEYLKGNFDIPIDSVITGNNIAYFFDRSFNDSDRFGKVIYKYDD